MLTISDLTKLVETNFRDSADNGVIVQNSSMAMRGVISHTRSLLATLARIVQPENVLEIGSYGYESADIMAATGTVGRIYSFDIRRGGATGTQSRKPKHANVIPLFWLPLHSNYDEFKETEYEKLVFPEFKNMDNWQIMEINRKILSAIAPEDGFDLIYIDGDHSYVGIATDWMFATEHAKKNTIIVIDDIWDDRHKPVCEFWDTIEQDKYDFAEWNGHYPQMMIGAGMVLYDREKDKRTSGKA